MVVRLRRELSRTAWKPGLHSNMMVRKVDLPVVLTSSGRQLNLGVHNAENVRMKATFVEEKALSKCFPEREKLYGICKAMRVQGKPQESYMTYTENGRKWFEFFEVTAFRGPGRAR